jgi:hypothetical protein
MVARRAGLWMEAMERLLPSRVARMRCHALIYRPLLITCSLLLEDVKHEID